MASSLTKITDFWKMPEDELEHLFLSGTVPDLDQWQDQKLYGTLLQLCQWDTHPVLLRWFWRSTTAIGLWLWTGKRFWRNEAGRFVATNLVGSYRWPLTALRMNLETEPSLLIPPKKVLSVQYDRKENPKLVYPVRDELVEVSPGRMLGRMLILRKNRVVPVSWFALERR